MSKIKYSSRFIKLLKLIDNNISKQLLSLENKDCDVIQNFIDITDKKDSVSFTPDVKAKEILSTLPQLWITNDNVRPLSHGSKNRNIYKDLGYTVPNSSSPWQPYPSTVGVILSEAKSRTSDNVYVVFKQYERNDNGAYTTVINKAHLEETIDLKQIWTTNRNVIKIGRLTRSLLMAGGVEFTTKDIEDFSNQFKAIYDFNSDATNKFDIVSGKQIAKWYQGKRYTRGNGPLNNSCMANARARTFDMYVENPQVKLIILYDDNGTIVDGKYTSNKIKGRAILWDAVDSKEGGIKFMDRIYVTNDSDFDLFKMYAELKGFWYKKGQNMDLGFRITNGVVEHIAHLNVKLDKTDFDYYPYLDSLAFLSMENGLCNADDTDYDDDDYDDNISYDRKLRCTNGAYEDRYGDVVDNNYDDESGYVGEEEDLDDFFDEIISEFGAETQNGNVEVIDNVTMGRPQIAGPDIGEIQRNALNDLTNQMSQLNSVLEAVDELEDLLKSSNTDTLSVINELGRIESNSNLDNVYEQIRDYSTRLRNRNNTETNQTIE